ncbi:hypothetical protein QJS04_geneDACA006887 [Acorus gramineus]|uniref:Isopentenyl phosphate kinase n=1 Tax=Acorus gramineus TaxID=55184 RepID=A0AAV9B0I7_ACOGR|nr:hypothetical protein QJS04_geneDACA006887 [Acorus gramineus]
MRGDESEKEPPPPPQNPSFGCRGILNRHLRCIVKLGGAAITCKNEIETINEENLKMVSLQLRRAMAIPDSSDEFLGMNWSKPDGGLDYVSEVENDGCPKLDLDSFVIVHGAGSFGHFQASKSGVHKGGLHLPLVKAGFVATRISVTSLNLEVVKALAREGIPSLGMSPLACGWSTVGRNMASADISHVIEVINNGFVPVLHGDAVLDDLQGCTILSGDVIIRYLAQQLRPDYVVFLTDVFGVYDRPPTDPSAILLREIVVNEDGSWHILNPTVAEQVDFTVAAHDTTGGMVTKISEAAMIAKLGIDVYIVKAGTSHSLRALKGEMTRDNIAGDWLGTIIRGSKTV